MFLLGTRAVTVGHQNAVPAASEAPCFAAAGIAAAEVPSSVQCFSLRQVPAGDTAENMKRGAKRPHASCKKHTAANGVLNDAIF